MSSRLCPLLQRAHRSYPIVQSSLTKWVSGVRWKLKGSCAHRVRGVAGLGKTIQVIAFMAHLKETYPDERYRHLIIVP